MDNDAEMIAQKLEGLIKFIDMNVYKSVAVTIAMICLIIWFMWWISKRWISHDWLKLLLMIVVPIMTFYLTLIITIHPILKNDNNEALCSENPIRSIHCISLDDLNAFKDDEIFDALEAEITRFQNINTTPGLLAVVPKPIGLATIFLCVLCPLAIFFANKRYLIA
jgi:hypothetical protein